MIDWEKVKVIEEDKFLGDKRRERSFLLKSFVIFFGVIIFMVTGVLVFQLAELDNVDKTLEVLKYLFGAIIQILMPMVAFYFGTKAGSK